MTSRTYAYEEAARLVEDRLRRGLRASALRALLSSRAKLARRRHDPRYTFTGLDAAPNEIVTDLAGCRVMVYQFSDVAKSYALVLFPETGVVGLGRQSGTNPNSDGQEGRVALQVCRW